MDRRSFLQAASAGVGVALIGANPLSAETTSNQKNPQTESTNIKENQTMKIILAADPIALELKDAILAHIKEKGHEAIDVGTTTEKKVDYFDCAQTACQMLQRGEADRAILFCGTGMGMSIIANKFAGITARSGRNNPRCQDVPRDQRRQRPHDGLDVLGCLERKAGRRRLP